MDEKDETACDLSTLIQDKNNLTNIKLYAHRICSEYLGGSWKTVKLDEFKLSRLSGGLSNYMYACEISRPLEDEPGKILLRIYGAIRGGDSLLNEIIQATLLGQQKLGPRVYGVFKHGRLEEYINAPTLKYEDYSHGEITRKIAEKLADFHMLNMPFSTEPSSLYKVTEAWMDSSEKVEFNDPAKKKLHETIKSFNLRSEYFKLKKVLLNTPSAVVFCHNDLQVGNILKTADLMLIDYEFAFYTYRGFDIGNHFIERMFDKRCEVYPYFSYNFGRYPTRDEQVDFVSAYIARFESNLAKSKLKTHTGMANLSVEAIVEEANVFALIAVHCAAVWALIQAAKSSLEFGWLELVIARADSYFKLKQSLFPNGYPE